MQIYCIFYLNFVLCSSLIPQLNELLNGLIKRNNLTTLLRSLVITVSPVDGPCLLLFSTDDHNKIVKSQLCCTDLLLHSVAADVDVSVDVLLAKGSLDLLDIVVGTRHDGNDHDLTRR